MKSIPGPLGTSGTPDNPKIHIKSLVGADDVPDSTNYNIFFNQDFNYKKSGTATHVKPNNQKLMVYFMAFLVDIHGTTFKYPTSVTVEWTPAPNLNLGNIVLDEANNCIVIGKPQTFHFSFTNSGGTAITQTFNVKVLVDGVALQTFPYDGLAGGGKGTGSFTYTFNSSKTITIGIDQIPYESTYSDNVGQFPITSQETCKDSEKITGDFHLEKTVMNFGESNSAIPKDVTVSKGDNCRLSQFGYIFTQGSLVWNTVGETGVSNAQGFNGPPYPKGMGAGPVSVTMKIVTSCGSEKIVGPKTFEIKMPAGNHPPVFNASWFPGGHSSGYPPIQTIVVDKNVDLGVVHDPTEEDPKTPYDQDGDGIIYYWDFAGSSDPWIQAIGEKNGSWNHDEHYSLIKADVLGTHSVNVRAMDTRGAVTDVKTVRINVVPPNPVPIIQVPPKIVEGRTFTPDFDGSGSYSPGGFTIVDFIWGNKKSMYPTAGVQNITLDVVDRNGLHALEPANQQFKVLEDLPPIAQLDYLNVGIRDHDMTFQDTSYSPDNDPIIEHTVTLTYDSNNDGSYADETPKPITTDSGGNFTFKPSQVGNYIVHIHLREGLGYKKSADKDFPFSVENLAPTVDYTAIGVNPLPPKITSVAPSGSELMNWSASAIGKTSKTNDYTYNSSDDSITTNGEIPRKPFKGITSSNIQKSMIDGYNSGNGNGAGYVFAFRPDFRLSKNLWLQTGYYNYYYNHLNVAKYKRYNSSYVDLEYGIPYVNGQNSHWVTMVMGWNMETNTLWERFYNHSTYSASPTRNDGTYAYWDFVDKFYRITDLENGNITPYFTKTTTVTTTWGYTSWRLPVEPPAPTEWVAPPEKKIFIPVTPTNLEIKKVKSNFVKDYAGNSYRTKCALDPGFFSSNVYKCSIQKVNSTGQVLWTESSFSRQFIAGSGGSNVYYVSSDNTKAVLLSGGNNNIYYVINNSTGASLFEIASSKVIGIYEDEIIYVDASNKLTFYNLVTGSTTSMMTVNPYGKGIVSADGKVVFANYYANIFVIDAATHTQLADVSTGMNYPTVYVTDYYVEAIEPVEDGKIHIVYRHYRGPSTEMQVITLTSDLEQDPKKTYNYGILSEGSTIFDGDVSVDMKYDYKTFSNLTSGVVFRKVDENNMYRTEVNPTSISIVKIEKGARTVLAKQDVTLKIGTYYTIKTHIKGGKITVFFNGVPLPALNITDSTFTKGTFGLYSEAQYVSLKKFFGVLYESNDSTAAWQAIVNLPITYTEDYKDAENDPAILSLRKWTFTNTAPQKFLDAGDGASDAPGANSYNEKVVNDPYPAIRKVGYFKVDYQQTDDPAPTAFKFPSSNFSSFQKASDPATHYIIVHRRPISQFVVEENKDHTISWTEQSYDPDRWLSPANYSTETTGLNYQNTQGIFDRRYSYTTPSGKTFNAKLVRPREVGTYTVREAVADEYGAWSDWYEVQLPVTGIPINRTPTAVLTFPNGTKSNPSYGSLTPTITWNQTDPDIATNFIQARILIKNESGTVVVDRAIPQNTTSTTAEWLTDTTLVPGAKYQVQVMVQDDFEAWSDWSNIGWMITNRPPTAAMTVPKGTQAAPTIFNSRRPTMQWNQTDPDPGTVFKAFQIWITNEANNMTILDSGSIAQSTTSNASGWTVTQDLPAGQKLRVMVRTFDGHVWSDYSPQTWMYINRAPVADFDWSPKPIWEGDTASFINKSTDPDGDLLTYSWNIKNPDSSMFSTTQKQFSSLMSMPGNYEVTLYVSDGLVTSSKTKTVSVSPLTIQSDVSYTELWLEQHQKSGHNTIQRPKDFYSGEIFVVETHSSSAPVAEAKAWIETIGLDGNQISISSILSAATDSTHFQGELFDPVLQSMTEGLPEGIQTIHFQITYANGVIKTEDVSINIIANVNQSVGIHRVR